MDEQTELVDDIVSSTEHAVNINYVNYSCDGRVCVFSTENVRNQHYIIMYLFKTTSFSV